MSMNKQKLLVNLTKLKRKSLFSLMIVFKTIKAKMKRLLIFRELLLRSNLK